MKMSSIKRFGLGAVAALVLTSCLSEMPRPFPTQPDVPVFIPTFVPVVTTPLTLARSMAKSNRAKYSDVGAKPAFASIGGTSMEMRALVGKDGATTVEATTGSFDGAPGTRIIDKASLRVLTSNLDPIQAWPNASFWSYTMLDVLPGDQLHLQAQVRGGGVSKTEVLRLTTTAVRRPDLSVLSVDGPTQTYPNASVTFFAPVSELNGSMGARSNCVLSIDGAAVDEAAGIWVDANGLVTCQFSYVFQLTGTYTVTVSATNVNPGDWDNANNVATHQITVVTPGTPISFGQLSVEEQAYEYLNTATRTGAYPIESSTGGSQLVTRVNFFGTTATAVPGPIKGVQATISSGGVTMHEATLTQLTSYRYVSGGATVDCADYSLNGETANSCTSRYPDGSGSSWFAYAHSTGTVTYYGKTLYCNTFGCNTYTNNGSMVTGWGERYGLTAGSVVRVQVSFTDATDQAQVSDRNVTLQDFSGPVNYDRSSCAPYWDGLGEVCSRQFSSGMVLRGLTTW